MKRKITIHFPGSMAHMALSVTLLIALLIAAPIVCAQAPSRFLGTVTAISGSTLTVKTDAGDVRQVDVPSSAALKRIEPGEKNLSAATAIQFSDLDTGDRVLVKLDPAAEGPVGQALLIIAVKQADLVKKQEQEREDWQRRGVGGLVKSVDSAAGVIVLTSGAGATARTITIHTTKATVLKRYAPGSVRFDEAQPAPIDAIHPGDQLRARGAKNESGTDIAAEEIVSGSFRNISGIISSIDPAHSTLAVKDLITKKQVTIHITADAQMRRLPESMAQMLAARLKESTSTAGRFGGAAQSANGGAEQHLRNSGQPGVHTGGPGGGLQQMLSSAPAISLSDLKKGETVMVVSTEGATEVTAITLLSGVEPLLTAPAGRDLLSNWSMDTSGGAPEAGPE
jgi:hypothetical protein